MPAKLPIVFFGSGPVAAASLRLLLEHCLVEVVITKPRPPHHKGSVPVLDVVAEHKLPVLTATNKAELSQVVAEHDFAGNLAVLIDFGIIVTQDVIDTFKYGIINSHFSLLPEWRGADPITFSILSGQPETGVSLMVLTAGMDEGPLLGQNNYLLPPDITGHELTDVLIAKSDKLLRDILPRYVVGQVKPVDQAKIIEADGIQPSYSRKLTKQDGILDFTKPAAVLEREVRAFGEWPRSRCVIAGQDVIIVKSHVLTIDDVAEPSTLYRDGKSIGMHTAKDVLVFDELKPAGKGTMSAASFVAGYLR